MIDRGECFVCGFDDVLHETTVVDRSGAAFALVCDACRHAIEQDRCRLCGERKQPRRAEGLYFNDEVRPAYHICDDCRNRLLSSRREVVIA